MTMPSDKEVLQEMRQICEDLDVAGMEKEKDKQLCRVAFMLLGICGYPHTATFLKKEVLSDGC
jgi:hypothetical protein